MPHKVKQRLYGQEFIDAELRIMRQIPKKYRGRVRELVNRMQLWDITVFMNIVRELAKPKESDAN